MASREQRRTKAPNTSAQRRRQAPLGWTEEMAERTMADNANSFKRMINSGANAVGASRSAASSSVTNARRNKQLRSEAQKTSGANAATKSAAAPFKKTSVEPRRVGGRPSYVEKQTVNRNALNGSASDSARKSIEAAFRKKR